MDSDAFRDRCIWSLKPRLHSAVLLFIKNLARAKAMSDKIWCTAEEQFT